MRKLMLFCLFSALLYAPFAIAQTPDGPKDKIAVLQIDTKGLALDPVQTANLARIELDKLGMFEVADRYDIDYLLEKEKLTVDKCLGKVCLVEIGRKLKMDKMLTGSAELIGENITITLRVIDVATESVEKSMVQEFLGLKNQVQSMLGITLQKMYGRPVDENLYKKLTKPFDYESALNQPEVNRLNLSGPRMGITFFSGQIADRFSDPTSKGGLDARPVMFQFGYQFETAYLNQGGLQALFEFIPIITGMDQGKFLPSVSVMHGLRSNRNGWELAFGPIVYGTKLADGFYNDSGEWTLLSDWNTANPGQTPAQEVVSRFDSRGDVTLTTSFIFGLGKSFKSGKLNIPLNIFFIPGAGATGHRFGVSVGFNGKG
jgi:hypothetical protein